MFFDVPAKTAHELNQLNMEINCPAVNDLCCIFACTNVGAKVKEDLQPMKGTSLTDISDSGKTNCTVAIWLESLSTIP